MRFLLLEPTFPRSVSYCLTSMTQTVSELPAAERLLYGCDAALEILANLEPHAGDPEALHRGARELRAAVADLHHQVVAACFDDLPAVG
jgi:uncharacterized alpha-E superfamily protein